MIGVRMELWRQDVLTSLLVYNRSNRDGNSILTVTVGLVSKAIMI